MKPLRISINLLSCSFNIPVIKVSNVENHFWIFILHIHVVTKITKLAVIEKQSNWSLHDLHCHLLIHFNSLVLFSYLVRKSQLQNHLEKKQMTPHLVFEVNFVFVNLLCSLMFFEIDLNKIYIQHLILLLFLFTRREIQRVSIKSQIF